jgi:hypothetical protein
MPYFALNRAAVSMRLALEAAARDGEPHRVRAARDHGLHPPARLEHEVTRQRFAQHRRAAGGLDLSAERRARRRRRIHLRRSAFRGHVRFAK